jgi:hypothetical protein
MRFCPLQRFPNSWQRHDDRASYDPAAFAFRFSQPLDALIRLEPAGLVSCQIRSWGSPFRALLLPRSRTPSPAPVPSCRWDAFPCWSPDPAAAVANAETPRQHWLDRSSNPSEQPSPSGLCSTRESATSGRLFRPVPSAWLSWVYAPPRCSPSPDMASAFTAPPLMRLSARATNRPHRPSTGCRYPAR